MKNLIYTCVFFDEKYIKMLSLLLVSYKSHAEAQAQDVDFVIFCSPTFEKRIRKIIRLLGMNIDIYTVENVKTYLDSECAKLLLFDYPKVSDYLNILYLSIDTLCVGNPHSLFGQDIAPHTLYAKHECEISGDYFGKKLFDFSKIDPKTRAFNNGILLFKNGPVIRKMFKDILDHANKYFTLNTPSGVSLDQPFFNFHVITKGVLNVDLISKYITLSPYHNESLVFCRFGGNHGSIDAKIDAMQNYLRSKCK
ncbi:MAG: hypothetical protein EBU90_01900 [Proteobacteria bacterium]|nr:hypothetical protein [Pseudomonadota bacterium]NBP13235.1 hypothetical protein [bacterium]